MNVVCVGDCGIDHYLPSGEKYFGGISANFARHARREFHADDRVHLISAVGDDEDAQIVLASLADSGIDCHVTPQHGATPVQFIEIQADGERRFVRYDEGVLRDFRLLPDEQALIANSDLLVAPVYLQIVGLFDDLMSISTRGLTSIDFADFLQHPDFALLERHLNKIDIGFFGLSRNDGDMIAEIRRLAANESKLFIVTLGADGSVAFDGAGQFDCAAVPVDKVVDTTGAGDAFAAGFLSRYCRGEGVPDSMAAGAQLAAGTVQIQGSVVAPQISGENHGSHQP
jgi:fructoselysine 6-kinase